MSTEEKMPQVLAAEESTEKDSEATASKIATDAMVEQDRSGKILKAKELYSQGSRNFLVKSYAEAADDLSQVCTLYEELYGAQSSELGMPYLLYAKSLIALAMDENKVIDVPDEVDEDDEEDVGDDDDDGGDEKVTVATVADKLASAATSTTTNGGSEKEPVTGDIKTSQNEADSTAADGESATADEVKEKFKEPESKITGEAQVSSSNNYEATGKQSNGATSNAAVPVVDGEKPSTSNGDVDCAAGTDEAQDDDEENDAATNLQLAWEILELAAKIFSRQGLIGLPNLAEVQTELANIEFENNIMDAARDDYEKALRIYTELPVNYHRAMAEIHYKIGLTYLMEQQNKEGAASLKEACDLIEAEITEIKSKEELTEKDKNNIQDMEETKQEIRAKIDEIEETRAQNIAEVRAALDSYIKPFGPQSAEDAGTSSAAAASSSSSSNITSSSKPTDISHLIKRKRIEEPSLEAESAESPAKRPAV